MEETAVMCLETLFWEYYPQKRYRILLSRSAELRDKYITVMAVVTRFRITFEIIMIIRLMISTLMMLFIWSINDNKSNDKCINDVIDNYPHNNDKNDLNNSDNI